MHLEVVERARAEGRAQVRRLEQHVLAPHLVRSRHRVRGRVNARVRVRVTVRVTVEVKVRDRIEIRVRVLAPHHAALE